MRSCDEIAELISASLDGQLTADEQTALDEHIARCPACSALLDDLRALHTAAADWEEVPAPAGFVQTVMGAIAAETAPKKADNVIPFTPKKAAARVWKKWGLSAAAIAIVVLGAVSAPSLMGNFSAKDAAEPERADMAYSVSDAAKDAMDSDAIQYAAAEAEEDFTVTAEKSSKPEAPAESALETQAGNASDPHCVTGDLAPSDAPQTDVERYTGILILEGHLKILDQYEGAACSDGTVTYLVSAEEFAAVFELLETKKPVGYGYAAGNPDAQQGKIIAPSN